MRILVFLLLKVLEIVGIIFLPYFVGKFYHKIGIRLTTTSSYYDNKRDYWYNGLIVTFGAIAIIGLVGILGCLFISSNWCLAGKILGVN
jgi:hypothetical protein